MTEADLPFAAALYASTRAEEVAASGWPLADQHSFLAQQHRAQHEHYKAHYPGMAWLILEQEGQAVGRLYLMEWESEFRVVDISLVASHRGRGIGAALFGDLMALAGARDKKLSIHVEKNNPARRLYDRLGFELAADKGVYDLLEWQPRRDG